MTLNTPEIMLSTLNSALRHLRGACTDLNDEEIDDKLLEVMRRLLLAELLSKHWIIAVGGSQGAGKTTLISCLYDLRSAEQAWLEGNEGRGEKIPILVEEDKSIQQAQGYVRRLVQQEGTNSFVLQDVPVDMAQFKSATYDPATGDLLPILRVPARYFVREGQAWLLLPGYEKQDRDNAAWQQLMRQALIGAGGSFIVTDEARLANQQQREIARDMRESELAKTNPYIIVTKTESSFQKPLVQSQLRASAQEAFDIPADSADRTIILTGTDDPDYVAHWMPQIKEAIKDINLSGSADRHLQCSTLADILGKDLTRVLNLIRSKTRLHFGSGADGDGDGAQSLKSMLERFDDAVDDLRSEHTEMVTSLLESSYQAAAKKMVQKLAEEHEGFKNWLSNVFDTTSETRLKMQNLVLSSWQTEGSSIHSKYAESLQQLTARKLGRVDEPPVVSDTSSPVLLDSTGSLSQKQISARIKTGYMHKNQQPVKFTRLTKEVVSDVRYLLGQTHSAKPETPEKTSEKLSKSVELLPSLALEYTRIAYTLPTELGIPDDFNAPAETAGGNLVQDGVGHLQAGVELGKTALTTIGAVLAVDIASDGVIGTLGENTGETGKTGENGETADAGQTTSSPLPLVSAHPAAVAATAAVAAAYITAVAVTRLRKYEKTASMQAHSMLTNVYDQHVNHLRKEFDRTISTTRRRLVEVMRARYRMDETLMKQDRLTRAIVDVATLNADLRHELNSSPVGLTLLATNSGA